MTNNFSPTSVLSVDAVEKLSISPMNQKNDDESVSSYEESAPYGITESVDETINVDTLDIYYHMKHVQTNFVGPKTYTPDFPSSSYRRHLVKWMSDTGEKCELSSTTIYTSVLFLDKLMREDHVPRTQLRFYAAVCISLAAKFEEAEELCPTTPEFLRATKLANDGITSACFLKGEMTVVKLLNYKLRAVTPSHITRYFLAKGVIFENDVYQSSKNPQKQQSPNSKLISRMKKYILFFCNLSLQDYTFQRYLASQLACAIVMASRASLKIKPLWRPELERLSGYEAFEIEPIFAHLWRYYEEQFPCHNMESFN